MAVRRYLVCAVLAGMLAIPGKLAHAQTLLLQATETVDEERFETKIFEDWQVICPLRAGVNEPTHCRTSPIVRESSGGNGIHGISGSLAELRDRDEVVPLFVVETSLGAALPRGVTLQVDDRDPARLAYRTCLDNGCTAPFLMSGQVLQAFRQGIRATVTFESVTGKKQSMTFSLVGFTAALDALHTQ